MVSTKRTTCERPWANATRVPNVPWKLWKWGFSFTLGQPEILSNYEWKVEYDRTGKSIKWDDMNGFQNPEDWPEMTYDQVDALFTKAEETDDPLSVVFYRMVDKDTLSPDQTSRLAHAPRVYAKKTAAEVAEKKEFDKNAVSDFIALANQERKAAAATRKTVQAGA